MSTTKLWCLETHGTRIVSVCKITGRDKSMGTAMRAILVVNNKRCKQTRGKLLSGLMALEIAREMNENQRQIMAWGRNSAEASGDGPVNGTSITWRSILRARTLAYGHGAGDIGVTRIVWVRARRD